MQCFYRWPFSFPRSISCFPLSSFYGALKFRIRRRIAFESKLDEINFRKHSIRLFYSSAVPSRYKNLSEKISSSSSSSIPIVDQMRELKLKTTVATFNTLMESYSTSGDIENLIKHFEAMKQLEISPNGKTYGIILEAFSRKGDTDQMIKYFEDMRQLNVQPTIRIFSILSNAFGKRGAVDKLLELFNQMKEMSIRPTVDICFTIVKTLSEKAEYAEKLEQFYDEMRALHIRPNAEIFLAIVDGLGKKGDRDGMLKFIQEAKEMRIETTDCWLCLLRYFPNTTKKEW